MYLILVIVAALAALGFAAYNFFFVKKLDEGTSAMQEIAAAIREGANTFINYEYKVLYLVVAVVAVIMAVVTSWESAVALVIGSIMSGCAGFCGHAHRHLRHVRVSNEARVTRKLGKTLQVAFPRRQRHGPVRGGLLPCWAFPSSFLIFGFGMGQLNAENFVSTTNWMGVSFVPFTMTMSGYALGCSIVAMFNRVGGGIYTKAADMGADLVGKTEAHIPEDDPRNPATIADNVGDNVGDVAGLGSDLLESYMGAISSAVILAFSLFTTNNVLSAGSITTAMLQSMFVYPVAFCSLGLIACVLGIGWLLMRKNVSDHPHKELNGATYVSAGLTLVLGLILTFIMFRGVDLSVVGFKLGWFSPWVGAALGLIAGVVIGMIAEYYTSAGLQGPRRPWRRQQGGPALTIDAGPALGMKSCHGPLHHPRSCHRACPLRGGVYGVAMSAVGMLSFVAATVSVDTYGPSPTTPAASPR